MEASHTIGTPDESQRSATTWLGVPTFQKLGLMPNVWIVSKLELRKKGLQ